MSNLAQGGESGGRTSRPWTSLRGTPNLGEGEAKTKRMKRTLNPCIAIGRSSHEEENSVREREREREEEGGSKA